MLALARGHLRESCDADRTDAMTTGGRHLHEVVATVQMPCYSIEATIAVAAVVVAVAAVAARVSTAKTAAVVAVAIAGAGGGGGALSCYCDRRR